MFVLFYHTLHIQNDVDFTLILSLLDYPKRSKKESFETGVMKILNLKTAFRLCIVTVGVCTGAQNMGPEDICSAR